MTEAPMASSRRPNKQRSKRLRRARRRAEQAGALAIAVRAEDGERHGAARNRQESVARAVEDGECHRRRRPDDGEDSGADGMQ